MKRKSKINGRVERWRRSSDKERIFTNSGRERERAGANEVEAFEVRVNLSKAPIGYTQRHKKERLLLIHELSVE